MARLLEIDPALANLYWAPTGIQNTLQNMQILCERWVYLNNGRLRWPVRIR